MGWQAPGLRERSSNDDDNQVRLQHPHVIRKMAWGFSMLTVQIVDDFSVRLVYLFIVELNIEVSG